MALVKDVVGGLLLGAAAVPAFACNLPALPVIPASDELGDRAPAVSAATSEYFEGIRAYATCIEDDLAAAGGDSAPASVNATLLARSNEAVLEAQAVQKLFQERVAAGQTPTPGSEAALRKLVEGIAVGMPDYGAMTPDLARTLDQQLALLQRGTAAAGAIRSIDFGGVDPEGRDIYTVHHENGTTNARIGLDAAGKIDFATLRQPMPPRAPRKRSTHSY